MNALYGVILGGLVAYGFVSLVVQLGKVLFAKAPPPPITLAQLRTELNRLRKRTAHGEARFICISWPGEEKRGEITRHGESYEADIGWLSACIRELEKRRAEEAQAVHSAKGRAKQLGLTVVEPATSESEDA